jgi:hypothetical protein
VLGKSDIDAASREHSVGFAVTHHLLAVRIKRVVNDPLRIIQRVIVLIAKMAKAFGDGLQSRPFGLLV